MHEYITFRVQAATFVYNAYFIIISQILSLLHNSLYMCCQLVDKNASHSALQDIYSLYIFLYNISPFKVRFSQTLPEYLLYPFLARVQVAWL